MARVEFDPHFTWRGYDNILPIDIETQVGTLNFQYPWFLKKGYSVSKSVCVIDNMGTGFLIGESLLITNHHIFRSEEWAQNQNVRFGNEYTCYDDQVPKVGSSYTCNPDVFFRSNEDLDYAVVYIDRKPGNEFGFIDISSHGRVKLDRRVNIIQHPEAKSKKIAIRANQVKFFNDTLIQYLTDTEPGSSGSPVFDDNWDIVGLHQKAIHKPDSKLECNQAHRIDAIWRDLQPHMP